MRSVGDERAHLDPRDAEAWVRFMAAALSAGPHAPIDKLSSIADQALAEYRKRREPGGVLDATG